MRMISKSFEKATEFGGMSKKKFFPISSESSLEDSSQLGVKGLNLCEMRKLDIPIPPGFIIGTTTAIEFYNTTDSKWRENFLNDCKKYVADLESKTNRRFGENFVSDNKTDNKLPLLLSVRSSIPFDIPGCGESILNVGMNDALVQELAMSQDAEYVRWAWDSYAKFLQMFGTTVNGVEDSKYRDIRVKACMKSNVLNYNNLETADLVNIVNEFKRLSKVPDDPWKQLELAIAGVVKSWHSSKADKFRDIYSVPKDAGTAVIIQTMVFGNIDNRSGVGIAFSRNPNTGDKEFVAEFVPGVNGDDVFGGVRDVLTTQQILEFRPATYYQVQMTLQLLENHYKDMQELEFTIEKGAFHVLQAQTGKRSPRAASRVAIDMVKENAIDEDEAIMRLDPSQFKAASYQIIDPTFVIEHTGETLLRIIGRGNATSGGAVSGEIVFNNQDAVDCRQRGINCILCRQFCSTEDIVGFEAANGVLTSLGGFASHAAVWLRSIGKPAVTAAKELLVDPVNEQLVSSTTGLNIAKGTRVTIDGRTGLVYVGNVPLVSIRQDNFFSDVINMARAHKKIKVHGSLDSEQDIQDIADSEADGVGLLTMERLFFDGDFGTLTKCIVLTESDTERAAYLTRLYEFQRDELARVFRRVGDKEITIRLLDCPINQVLPDRHHENFRMEVETLAEKLGVSHDYIYDRVEKLYETNPVLGLTGCSQAVLRPYLISTQVRAIVAATVIVRTEGLSKYPRILLPSSFSDNEVARVLPLIHESIIESSLINETSSTKITDSDFPVGVSISTPRACFKISDYARLPNISFVCIDIGELTQYAFGISQSTADKFMTLYEDKRILSRDPYQCIDSICVGKLFRMAVDNLRQVDSNAKINVVGPQVWDPITIRFLDAAGIDEVTVRKNNCIPGVIVAAAQSAIHPERMKLSQRKRYDKW